MSRNDDSRRLWIEFEISRADPVANHAKFATAHLFQPQMDGDVFVSMVSAHVARGRHNLAANTVQLMRYIGMRAFQVPLFPDLSADTIHRLNHADYAFLEQQQLDVNPEVQRILMVTEPIQTHPHFALHFAGNQMEVLLNLRRWNDELATAEGQALWGRRTITYFVFDTISGHFAPAKFCAYIALSPESSSGGPQGTMTVSSYATLQSDRRFDGNRAWMHLVENLGMHMVLPADAAQIYPVFTRWLQDYERFLNMHPNGPTFVTWSKTE
jgi:hypothetical protein